MSSRQPLKRVRWRSALALTGAALLLAPPGPGNRVGAQEPDGGRAVLVDADLSRGDPDGVTWEVTLEGSDGTDGIAMTLAVQSRGFDYIARVLDPPKSRGQRLLMRGGNLWFHKPDLSKPVPLSQRQVLLGDAAYGDIAATDYATDYGIESVAPDTVDNEACRRFELVARTRRATYDRLRYWVSVPRGVGVKAEYFTRGGRLLKSARMEYANTVTGPGGRSRAFISRMIISDEMQRGRGTSLLFSRPTLRPIPHRVFDVNLLSR